MKDISKLKKEFNENFGTLNGNQLWSLVKLAKHVRLRCKNNTAFNNFMNAMFDNARFSTVTKKRINWRTKLEETYPGLSITVDNVPVEQEEDEE